MSWNLCTEPNENFTQSSFTCIATPALSPYTIMPISVLSIRNLASGLQLLFIDYECWLTFSWFIGRSADPKVIKEMIKEAPSPLNFTGFLTMFGEKLGGKGCAHPALPPSPLIPPTSNAVCVLQASLVVRATSRHWMHEYSLSSAFPNPPVPFLGRDPDPKMLDEMLGEAPGPLNFTMFLTLFGDKLKGTFPSNHPITLTNHDYLMLLLDVCAPYRYRPWVDTSFCL